MTTRTAARPRVVWRRRGLLGAAGLLLVLGAPACFTMLELEGAPCPCARGHQCCEGRCLKEEAACWASAWSSVTVGLRHTCAIAQESGAAYCWGAGDRGQLGTGALESSLLPKLVLGGLSWRQLVAGDEHSCGLTSTGQAYCWGAGDNGRLGLGESAAVASSPQRVSGGLRYRELAAGRFHTCGVAETGEALCWGGGSELRLGNGDPGDRQSPTRVAGGLSWRALTGGARYSCGIATSGSAFCWGSNQAGQLGASLTDEVLAVPTLVAGDQRWAQLSAGIAHTCGVTEDGAALCWGRGQEGQLGTGEATVRALAPQGVEGAMTWSVVDVGGGLEGSSCGLTTGGAVYCWGMKWLATPGAPALSPELFVSAEEPPTRSLSVGPEHACLVEGAGRARCWGRGTEGQLGSGEATTSSTPVLVPAPDVAR